MSDLHGLMADEPDAPRNGTRTPVDRREILKAVAAMFLSAVVVGLLAAMALLLLLVTDRCGPGLSDCNPTLFSVGFFVALLVPPVLAIVGFLATAVLVQRRRARPWRVPLLVIPASVVAWAIGAGITFASVPGYGVGDYLDVLWSIGG